MRIIEAGIAHAAALARMHGEAFPADPWDTASFMALLRQPGMLGLIDEAGGFLLLRVVADEAEVITLGVVRPRQGIATHLLQAALDRAKGVARVHLEVAEGNAAALALYERFGFTRVGVRKGYYPDGGAALTLTLDSNSRAHG
jgi:ribosomal-protein-alanine N-acetyltransferase